MQELLMSLFQDRSSMLREILSAGFPLLLFLQLGVIVVIGALIHGAAMGSGGGVQQAFAAAVKAPLVPLCSLALTFPLLFTVNVAAGGSATLGQTLTVAMVPLALMMMLLASAAPVLWFFSQSADYHFVKLTNVAFFAAVALFSMVTLRQMIGESEGVINKRVFELWVVIYGFTGAQMAWIFRPFLGAPHLEFQWFRPRGSKDSFYSTVMASLATVISGESRREEGESEGGRQMPESRRRAEREILADMMSYLERRSRSMERAQAEPEPSGTGPTRRED